MNELFDLGKYSAAPGATSKKLSKKYSVYTSDPAWDDGSAFPPVSSKNDGGAGGEEEQGGKELTFTNSSSSPASLASPAPLLSSSSKNKNDFEVGDRLLLKHTDPVGIVLDISPDGGGHIKWEGSETEDINEYSISATYFEKLPPAETVAKEEEEENDRWNPAHFGENPPHEIGSDGQLTIFYDDSHEPPDPDDYKTIQEYEEAHEQWERLHNSTCAVESAQDSATVGTALGSTSSELPKSMSTAPTSSSIGTQECLTMGTLKNSPSRAALEQDELTLSQHLHPVPPSVSKESDWGQMMNVIASPQCSTSSLKSVPALQPLRMCPDSSVVDTDQEAKECTATTSLTDWQHPDTDWKQLSFPVVTLGVPSIDSDYCWLPSPTALSSKASRPPGQSKLENFLRETGALKKEEVCNPEFLEVSFSLPLGWTDPQDSRSISEFLEETQRYALAEQPLEICLTRAWHMWRFLVFCTCITLLKNELSLVCNSDECNNTENNLGICGVTQFSTCTQSQSTTATKFLEESSTNDDFSSKNKLDDELIMEDRGTYVLSWKSHGCLYKYLENKKLKSGLIASYPRVEGERDPDNPKHWRWGFNWEEKIDGEWKGRSIGSVPVGAIPMIQSMQKLGVPLKKIISFIRRSKVKK